jgi:hypothetical protein
MHQTIEMLTSEQEELIFVYQTKWKNIALSIERINHRKAAQAVRKVYDVLGLPPPHIDFFANPYRVFDSCTLNQLTASERNGLQQHYGKSLQLLMHKKLWGALHKQLRRQLSSPILDKLNAQLLQPPPTQLLRKDNTQPLQLLPTELPWKMAEECYPLTLYYISSNWWAYTGSFFDFCISVLKCSYSTQQWETYQAFAKECGWIYPFETIAFVCDRPTKLSVDDDGRLHAEGKPAIEFLGEPGVYAYHGRVLP